VLWTLHRHLQHPQVSTGGAGSTDSADVNAAGGHAHHTAAATASIVSSGEDVTDCNNLSDDKLLDNVPNQPMSTDSFPVQVLSGRTLVFQTSWYQKFPFK